MSTIIYQNNIDYKPKVSVIIPVYNTEKYLNQCLDSIINQTLKEIEIICIDDGSTDSSLEILKEYASKDNRIKVLTQNNLGAGTARNKGLKIAIGDFLYFLDSDDYIKESTLETLYKKSKETNSDLCLCRHQEFNTEIQSFIDCPWSLQESLLPQKEPFNLQDMPENLLDLCPPMSFIKLFKNEFIKKHNIYFQEIKTCNDVFFNLTAMLLAKRISVVNEVFCIYRTQHENLTKTRGKHAECIEKAYKKTKETIEQKGLLKTCEETLYKAAISNFTYEYGFCDQIKKVELLSLAKDFFPKKYFNILLKNLYIDSYQRYFWRTLDIIKCQEGLLIKLFNTFILRNSEDERHKIITLLGLKLKIKRNVG